jgi:hypothetical protein
MQRTIYNTLAPNDEAREKLIRMIDEMDKEGINDSQKLVHILLATADGISFGNWLEVK